MGKKSFRRGLFVFVMAAALFFPGACSKSPQKKPSNPAVKVAVAAADMQWDGMQVMRAAVDKRSKQEGVEITWLDAGNDFSRQKKQVEDLLKKAGAGTNGIKAVVFHPVDPLQSGPLVEALVRSGVKVLVLEKLVPNVPLDGYIASDHLQTGRLQARYAVNSAAGSSGFLNAVIFRGDPADPAVREIVDGIKGALNEKVRVVGEVEHPRVDPAAAGKNILAVLQKNKVDVLFATDGRLAAGAAAALKAAGLQDSVVTIGAGADRSASRSLLAGDHDAEVDPMPDLMGQYILDAAASLAKTGHWQYETSVDNGNYRVPAKITPVRLIDRTNSYLLEQRWGKEPGKEQAPAQGGEKGGESGSGGSENSGTGEGEGTDKGAGTGGSSQEAEGGKRKTKLRVITQDGKTVELEIPGEIKSIESSREEKKGGGTSGGT